MARNDLTSRYFEATTLKPRKKDNKELKAALDRAHEIRRFEIELYWKRANYFWLFQAAAFTAFGILSGKDGDLNFALAFAAIGLICALAGLLAAKGSKFWQENWEKHIDMLEDAVEGKLHKTVWVGPDGVQFSVSRINDSLNLILVVFWAGLLVVTAAKKLNVSSALTSREAVFVGLFAIAAAALWLCTRHTKLQGDIYVEGVSNWHPYPSDAPKKYAVLRRHKPDGKS